MRSLALLLLLANIIFWWWQLSWLPWLPWQPSQFIDEVPSETPPVSDLPHLVLLKESHSVNGVASASASDKMGHGQVSNVTLSKAGAVAVEAAEIKVSGEKKAATESKEPLTGKMTPVYNGNDADVPEKHRQTENGGNHRENVDTLLTEKMTPAYDDNDTNASEKHRQVENGDNHRESVDTLQNRQKNDVKKDVVKPLTDLTSGGPTHTADALSSPSSPETLENTSKPKSSPLAEQFKPAPERQTPVRNTNSVTCFKAGPYLPLAEAKKVADWLKNQGQVSVEVQNRETPVSTKTWVYLPSLGNRQAALRVVQRLSQQGITGQGIEPNYAISLGVFKNKENAVRRVKELQAKGYDEVKTEEHHENEIAYWLSVKIANNPKSVLNTFEKRFKEGPVLEAGTCESEK